MNERNVQKLFGVPIFYYEDWEDCDVGEIQCYNVFFPFPSMQEYNNSVVVYNLEGKITIYNNDDDKVVWEGYVCDIPEFMEAIKKG